MDAVTNTEMHMSVPRPGPGTSVCGPLNWNGLATRYTATGSRPQGNVCRVVGAEVVLSTFGTAPCLLHEYNM